MKQEDMKTTTITFNSHGVIFNKDFGFKRRTIRHIILEGNLQTGDYWIVKLDNLERKYYGTAFVVFDDLVVQNLYIELVTADGTDRVGIVTIHYFGAYFESETVGSSTALPTNLQARY